ncbi:hypothetical protein RND71_035507 [Anisodus tanguticus]|uniref:Uncharacterized protein n=1 Tax=Anisodus tanguticus TaxID=243964 RepID=A0AAE1R501_9SOLA|nr:hypothetical protein RND71_035507 [Anisodus tanguticus]
MDELKLSLVAVEGSMQKIQETLDKVLSSKNEVGTDVGKLRVCMEGLQNEGVKTVNKLISRVNSLNKAATESNAELAVAVQKSYSALSHNVETSYNSLSNRIINTLKYF